MADDLNFDLDLTQTTADDLEGINGPPPGKWHVVVDDVTHHSEGKAYLKLKLRVLAGTDKAGVGTVFHERFYMSEAAIKRLGILAKRAKLIGEDDYGTRASVNWSKLRGRHLIVETIEEEYETERGTKGKSCKMTYAGMWDPSDTRVASVPKDEAAIKAASSGKSASKGKSKPPAAKDEDWGEI
jgi:hypothetical protein